MLDLKQILLKELLTIPGVTEKIWQGKQGNFSSLVFKDKDFAHFHSDNELDLRLTAKVIKAEKVSRIERSLHHPDRANNSPWIELRFTTPDDLPKIINLVKLAIAQI